MLEAYSLQTGTTTIDLREVVEYSKRLVKSNGHIYQATFIATRYGAKHILLLSYADFQEVFEGETGRASVKTF